MWKRGEIAPQEQFLLFSTLLYIHIFLKLDIHLLNVVVQFIVFLTLSTLICRSTYISKCFSESLGIRDNGSRLYFLRSLFRIFQEGVFAIFYMNQRLAFTLRAVHGLCFITCTLFYLFRHEPQKSTYFICAIPARDSTQFTTLPVVFRPSTERVKISVPV